MTPPHWPKLSYDEAKDTYQTLHLWTQVIGKIKLNLLPWINHSWHTALYITPVGITTGPMATNKDHLEILFDLTHHELLLLSHSKGVKQFSLQGHSVASFYERIFQELEALGVDLEINPVPNEIADAIPFPQDQTHAAYESAQASTLHQALLQANNVFTEFRSEFIGKCSPVHFFWGSFDLAVSRFSGRKAPQHPGGVPNLPDWVAREAYSHEVSSSGFWPGNDLIPFAAFYNYIYPEPEGFKTASISPDSAYYDDTLGEYILPYDAVQSSSDPEQMLLDFLRSSYNAAADLSHWDRDNLEQSPYKPALSL